MRARNGVLDAVALGAVVASLALAGCGANQPTATTTRVATSTASPVQPTATPSDPCVQATILTPTPAFNGATSFPGVPYPPQSVATIQTFGGADGVAQSYSIQATSVCTPGATPAQIQAFYVSQLPTTGWARSATFPSNGHIDAACPDTSCWMRTIAGGAVAKVALTSVRASGTVTLYTVQYVTYKS